MESYYLWTFPFAWVRILYSLSTPLGKFISYYRNIYVEITNRNYLLTNYLFSSYNYSLPLSRCTRVISEQMKRWQQLMEKALTACVKPVLVFALIGCPNYVMEGNIYPIAADASLLVSNIGHICLCYLCSFQSTFKTTSHPIPCGFITLCTANLSLVMCSLQHWKLDILQYKM